MSVRITNSDIHKVSVSRTGENIKVVENPNKVYVQAEGGPQGPQGIQGIQGIQGVTGPTGPLGAQQTLHYIHDQDISSNTWDITHNLNFYPNATVVDSSGATCEGEIEYISINRLKLTFSAAFSGSAYLS